MFQFVVFVAVVVVMLVMAVLWIADETEHMLLSCLL
jgi:hypothetical protein